MEDIIQELLTDESIDASIRGSLQDEFSHGMMVSNLAIMLSKELGESEEFCREMGIAGLLHDIGKLKVNKYLYANNEDTLVIEQMKYARMHTAFSYNILKKEGFSENIVQSVYHHHENFDGSGYPDNLKGTSIPWGARILRTCDVFSALVSKRSYRDAFDVETTVELMIDEINNYDMQVFLAFQRVLHSELYLGIEDLKKRVNSSQMIGMKVFQKEVRNT